MKPVTNKGDTLYVKVEWNSFDYDLTQAFIDKVRDFVAKGYKLRETGANQVMVTYIDNVEYVVLDKEGV